MRALAVVGALVVARTAHAAPDEALAKTTIVFARGNALYRATATGKDETELVKLPANKPVRALRTDAGGTVLLADVGGKWSWMPLDGAAARLVDLPCAEGPAQLANDGTCVLCRSTKDATRSVIVILKTGKVNPVDASPAGARLVSTPAGRRLVWADASGVWSAPPGNLASKTKVAPEPPLRSFLPSPDGARAIGVYEDMVFEGPRNKKPGPVLMNFALDGQGGRRKAIREGVPVEWSHDSQWILVQNGAQACIVKSSGGQYKCWKGYTAASIAPDGSYALLLGNRESKKDKESSKDKKRKKSRKGDDDKKKKDPPKQTAEEQATAPEGEPEVAGGEDEAHDDVAVPPPTGPLSLYRARLAGPFVDSPAVVTSVVDGAAVWIPTKP